MSLIKKNIKIATVLPYKENYTYTKASAASLWVSEFIRIQNLTKITIFTVIQKTKII